MILISFVSTLRIKEEMENFKTVCLIAVEIVEHAVRHLAAHA